MPYDPTLPLEGTLIDAVQMRSQLQGLQALIPAGITNAQVDSTTTLATGNPATAAVALAGNVLHFDFGIPEGQQGVAGEVTQAQLSNDLVNCQNAAVLTTLPQTSNNSNGVGFLGISISDPPTQSEVQNIVSKLDELINALRR